MSVLYSLFKTPFLYLTIVKTIQDLSINTENSAFELWRMV